MIDLDRIEKILAGDEEPQTLGEECFLSAYKAGVEGELFFTYLLNIGHLYDKLNKEELHLQDTGYALGQRDCEEIDDVYSNKTKKNNLH